MTPEDVKAIGPDVLRHRIILTYEAEAEEVTSRADRAPRVRGGRGAVSRDPDRECMPPRSCSRSSATIEIRTARLANEQLAGQYHSVFKGSGIAFREVRQYQPGDDIRFIDWNVSRAHERAPTSRCSSRSAR